MNTNNTNKSRKKQSFDILQILLWSYYFTENTNTILLIATSIEETSIQIILLFLCTIFFLITILYALKVILTTVEYTKDQVKPVDLTNTDKSNNNKPANLLCNDCNILVDKTTKHCKRCKVCVQEFDHHCRVLNKCISKKNYGTFFTLLFVVGIELVFKVITVLTINLVYTFWDQKKLD